jgi:preprotein translocase SecE subunit
MARQLRRSGAAATVAAPARKSTPRTMMRPDFGTRGRGFGQFLVEVRSELKKVVWPTRDEATKLTALVVAISVIVGFFLGGVDFAFTKLFELLVK